MKARRGNTGESQVWDIKGRKKWKTARWPMLIGTAREELKLARDIVVSTVQERKSLRRILEILWFGFGLTFWVFCKCHLAMFWAPQRSSDCLHYWMCSGGRGWIEWVSLRWNLAMMRLLGGGYTNNWCTTDDTHLRDVAADMSSRPWLFVVEADTDKCVMWVKMKHILGFISLVVLHAPPKVCEAAEKERSYV